MIPRFLLAVASLLMLAACTKDVAEPQASAAEVEANSAAVELHFHAIAGLNPGANGQAAPVRVRIFELKNAATFGRSDYFALADRAQSTLGLDLLDQDEVMVQPGQQLSIQRDLDPSTRQIGLLVGYRELDRAQWRTVLNVPPRQYTEYQISLDVRAVRADVVVSPSSPAQ
ncbi:MULTISPECIES: type VI secretion system lipoprotein TssJ [Pseudomonas]|jgi:type VI secretion system protein VasD|uniref:Type VI secretion system lipoprotein TssJ n=1 Tax=Pseudomonas veronii TaxID=76761 RepID=A0A439E5A2_PSEVE|nr:MULTISPECIES: type VI secretion system lipoprotein TssJ [Pseudomonas]MCT8962727.1 type VI secretion system lipoprotein TssJ [Pseudomonas veronii]MCT9822357.1 type VI secretion system lipoprotein TssJ [Pseudomonas veronii]NWC55918.1 type VI secretion system lipoprotein TssJ [Pseudomonas veronii]PUB20779.1 type VI secretion system protein VasD [Pseudomonas sp. GV105]QCG65412.1 type VI secretion system lipoprotein TssJ [Pseudomonas veronii]